MDTATHTLFGLGLGGLAMTDPVLASDSVMAAACMLGTVAGSQAPDLDSLFRFKSNADYIKQHRGLSHSLVAIPVWACVISWLISLLFPDVPLTHLAFWVLASVILHVVADLFNSYGTKAFWPFRKSWIRWNIVPYFDPVIFGSHLAAILLWIGDAAHPAVLFPVFYAGLAGYYFWRKRIHRNISAKVPFSDSNRHRGDQYTVLPAISPYFWHVIKQSESGRYQVGEYAGGVLTWQDSPTCTFHPAAEASKSLAEVKAFLALVPFPCVSVKQHTWGYQVRWEDIRYRYQGQYPFAAVALLDGSLTPMESYVGWLSETRLSNRLRMNAY